MIRAVTHNSSCFRLNKGVGLDQAYADPKADDHHDGREQEWHSPAPGQKGLGPLTGAFRMRQQPVDREKDAIGDDEAQRRAELKKCATPGAFARGCIFGRNECRARPLATQCESLRQPQNQQQERGDPADVLKGGQTADEKRGDAHREQRGHQGGLAAEAVAEMAEHDRAEGSGHHRGTEHTEGGEERGGVVAGGKNSAGKTSTAAVAYA